MPTLPERMLDALKHINRDNCHHCEPDVYYICEECGALRILHEIQQELAQSRIHVFEAGTVTEKELEKIREQFRAYCTHPTHQHDDQIDAGGYLIHFVPKPKLPWYLRLGRWVGIDRWNTIDVMWACLIALILNDIIRWFL